MQNVKIKALDAFAHGRIIMAPGQIATINAGDAGDLERAGLVEIIGESPDADDLIGKAATVVSNKMQPKTPNK